MALLASQFRNGGSLLRLLPRTSLLLSQKASQSVSQTVSQTASQTASETNRKRGYRSLKFPEYSLIYDFHRIRAFSGLNRFKRRLTKFVAVVDPPLLLLDQYIPPPVFDYMWGFASIATCVTIFFHTVGMYVNNTIAYVYLHDNGESVKLSCVDYWGHRVDIDTKISEIAQLGKPVFEISSPPLFYTVRINGSKTTYKMYDSVNNIISPQEFVRIFGNLPS